MSFKRIVTISLCLSWLSAGAMDTQKQTITIKQPVKYINSKPIIIPTSTAQAKPVRLSMQQAFALVHTCQAHQKPAGSIIQQLQQRPPVQPQTIVPQSLQKYTHNVHEYMYREVAGKMMLATRSTCVDSAGKLYSKYTNCVSSVSGGKPVVLTVCTNNQQDMTRFSILLAKEYIASESSKCGMEVSLAVMASGVPGVPTIGDMVRFHDVDPAGYNTLLQFAEGIKSYEEINEQIRALDAMRSESQSSRQNIPLLNEGETYVNIFTSEERDFPVRQKSLFVQQHGSTQAQAGLVMTPSESFSSFNQQYFPSECFVAPALPARDQMVLTVEFASSSELGVRERVAQVQFEQAMQGSAEKLRPYLSILFEFDNALERMRLLGITSLAQYPAPDLVKLKNITSTVSRTVSEIFERIPELPRVLKKEYLNKQKTCNSIIGDINEIFDKRRNINQKFCNFADQCSLDQLYLLKQDLEKDKAALTIKLEPKKQEVYKLVEQCKEIEARLKVYKDFGGKYFPDFLRQTCNFFYDSLTNDLTRSDLIKGQQVNRTARFEAQEIASKLLIKHEFIESYIDVVDARIKHLENGYVQNQKDLIADRLAELSMLKEQCSNPTNIFEQGLSEAINNTLQNQDEIIIAPQELEPVLSEFLTSLKIPGSIFAPCFVSSLGQFIRQFSVNTIKNMQSIKYPLDSVLIQEGIHIAVLGFSGAMYNAQIGEYTKAIQLAKDARSLSMAIEAACSTGLTCPVRQSSALVMERKVGDYLLARYVQANCGDFSALKQLQASTIENWQAAVKNAMATGEQLASNGTFVDILGSSQSKYREFLAAIAQQNSFAQDSSLEEVLACTQEVRVVSLAETESPEIQAAVYQTIEKQLAVHADEETVIFLPEAVPFKLEDIVDMTTTAAMRLGENSKADRELACKLLVQLAPAIGKGVANGLINLANPFNALLVPLYKIRLAAEVAGFTLRESLNFAQYLHYKMSGQQDTADSMLAKCAEPFKHVAAGWEKLDDAAKVEMISQVVTEIVAGGKVSEICNRFEKSVLDKAAQYVSNPTIAKVIKVVSDFRGNGSKQQLAQGVVEDVEVVKVKDGKQVVARYDRYIQTMRLKLDKLEKYWDAKLTAMKDPLFNKAKLKHLFGIEKTQKVRASGEIDAKYAGFHHDKEMKLVKTGKVEFVTERKIDPRTGAYKVEKLKIEGTLVQDKTFFPAEWSRCKVIDKIFEASNNIIKNSIKDGITCWEAKGTTAEGLEILFVIRKADKSLITAYPVLDNL